MASKRISDLPHIATSTAISSALQHSMLDRSDPQGVEYVRLTWVDFSNNPRCRIIPYASYRKLLKKNPPAVRLPKITFGYFFGRAAPGFNAVGNWLLVIDPKSLRRCAYKLNTAIVFGWFREVQPVVGRRIAAPLCPRYILHRVLQLVSLK